MIQNQMTINNVDISVYGATLIKGGYEAFLTPPERKELITNESRLSHGTQVLNEPVKYQQRDLQLQFFIEGSTEAAYLANYTAFLGAITNGVIVVGVPVLNTLFRLVYLRCSKYGNYGKKKGKFAIAFREYDVSQRTLIDSSKQGVIIT